MTQASRNEFAFAEAVGWRRSKPSMVHGRETPVTSPALEMQRALDEMLTAPARPSIAYGRGLLLTIAMAGAATVCAAFWVGAVNWAASLFV